MKIINQIVMAIVMLLLAMSAQAQQTTAMKTNEILVINQDNIQDDSGVNSNTNNVTLDKNEKLENFKQNDANGIGMAITAMAVVFFGLILLYVIFKLIGNTAVKLSRKRTMKAAGVTKEQAKGMASESGEVFAAIAMAIYEVTENEHDDENTVLTIKNVARNYSPWSSKIYTLRELPKR